MVGPNGWIISPGHRRPRLRSSRSTTLFLVLILMLFLACDGEPPVCSACGREVHDHTAVILTLEDGTRTKMCCPRCAVRSAGERPRPVAGTVHDFETGDSIDFDRAIYVEGSDVHTCRGPILRPLLDDAGGQLLPVYDRCEPSVVAFARREAAADFVHRHGGRITDWPSLVRTQREP